MDVLEKVKSATLIEALVATILIIIIFVVSSLIINNLLLNNFNNDTTTIENRIYELEYNYQNKKIKIPYNESFKNWEISINKTDINKQILEIKAQKNNFKKIILKRRIDEK
jgi:predicted PurR-regulated permease PerM